MCNPNYLKFQSCRHYFLKKEDIFRYTKNNGNLRVFRVSSQKRPEKYHVFLNSFGLGSGNMKSQNLKPVLPWACFHGFFFSGARVSGNHDTLYIQPIPAPKFFLILRRTIHNQNKQCVLVVTCNAVTRIGEGKTRVCPDYANHTSITLYVNHVERFLWLDFCHCISSAFDSAEKGKSCLLLCISKISKVSGISTFHGSFHSNYGVDCQWCHIKGKFHWNG